MNPFLIGLIACLLVSCGEMKPVTGAPEVLILRQAEATVTVQPDGQRLITIHTGENVSVIILLPPAKEASPKVSIPVEATVSK